MGVEFGNKDFRFMYCQFSSSKYKHIFAKQKEREFNFD